MNIQVDGRTLKPQLHEAVLAYNRAVRARSRAWDARRKASYGQESRDAEEWANRCQDRVNAAEPAIKVLETLGLVSVADVEGGWLATQTLGTKDGWAVKRIKAGEYQVEGPRGVWLVEKKGPGEWDLYAEEWDGKVFGCSFDGPCPEFEESFDTMKEAVDGAKKLEAKRTAKHEEMTAGL